MKDDKKLLALSPQQPLGGQRVLRISGLNSDSVRTKSVREKLEFRLGTWNIGSLCCRGVEVCETLRKRRVDVCCIQEVRWRGSGSRFLGVKGRRYKLWWSGNDSGVGGVGILIKEELYANVVEVQRRSDRVMAIVLAIGLEVIRVVSAYGPQRRRTTVEKQFSMMN